MLGQTYTVGPCLNNNEWKLDDDKLGLGFENHIFNVLSKNLVNYFDLGVRLARTSKVRDDGKDIILESPVSLENVLGVNFYLKDKQTLKVYIECKSSNRNKISYDSFVGNLSRIKEENVGYYVLVTNTTIVPFSYYHFKQESEKLGIEFILIDQFLLAKYLLENKAMLGEASIPDTFDNIYIEYQSNSCIIASQKAYEIFFWIRNYSDSSQIISMQMNTDRNWKLDFSDIECIVGPKNSHCLKFCVIKEHFDGIDDLILNIKSNSFDTSIQIKGINISYNFRPELTGKKNKEIISLIKKSITENCSNRIHFLIGEAGVGKTRIIDEIESGLLGRDINFSRIVVEKNKSTLIQIQELLQHEDYLPKKNSYNSFTDIFNHIDTTYRKCTIIIDDLHNASIDLLNDIRQALDIGCPSGLTLIFVGRDDFSVDNIDYFSFLQFCKEKYMSTIISVEALTDTETRQLIKSIVRGIPSFALEKIHSLSNNLPLFIIQVIEYMLDLKIVYLLNRNTVGIENIDNFSTHLYIPSSMEGIYKKRIQCLLKQEDGKYLLNFLYIASFLGIKFPDNIANIYFDRKEELLKKLLERRYIIPTSAGYSFMHESLYLYIQHRLFNSKNVKKEIADWLFNVPCIFNEMGELKQGRICLWKGNRKDAYMYFSSLIHEVNTIRNYSSININPDYYIYLEDIYSISTTYKKKKNVVASKIYIALHYHTPYEAVAICNWAQQKLRFNKQFQKDYQFGFYLKEQMAHSYINAGHLKKGEVILADLLSETILNMQTCDKKAVFDMYDKLSNIYIKYNCFIPAQNYCRLSLALAIELKDSNLQALSYITTAKLYLYTNKKKSKEYLNEANRLLTKEFAYRIKCHNDVSLLIMDLMEQVEKDEAYIKELIVKSEDLLNICLKNNFANSVIRIYMLLAVLYYLLGLKNGNFDNIIKYIEKGIDASIKFGISTYIWQFYNLKAIIFVRQNQEVEKQKGLFDTVFNLLKKQGLTYLGNCDFTYGNLLALTNILFFYRHKKTENIFYQKICQLSLADTIASCDFNCNKSLCQYECQTNLEVYQKEWNRLSFLENKQSILFGKTFEKYTLQDNTGYYIILS